MKETFNYLFYYIDELDDNELINLKEELINDIEYLKIIKDNKSIEFETLRLNYINNLLQKRDEENIKKLSI